MCVYLLRVYNCIHIYIYICISCLMAVGRAARLHCPGDVPRGGDRGCTAELRQLPSTSRDGTLRLQVCVYHMYINVYTRSLVLPHIYIYIYIFVYVYVGVCVETVFAEAPKYMDNTCCF